jgi:hypothetical protein
MEISDQRHSSADFLPEKEPPLPVLIEDLLGPTTGMDALGNWNLLTTVVFWVSILWVVTQKSAVLIYFAAGA